MIVKILIGLAIVIAVFAAFVASRPDDVRVSRSIVINSPASAIYLLVNDQRKHGQWAPWDKLDPNIQKTFEGQQVGIGSITRWSGNNQVGKGSSTIIENRPDELVKFHLDFEAPMKATNTAEFTFEPQGDATLVTWVMYGKANFMAKAVNIIMDCDKMVGEQFEIGLKSLKEIVEHPAAQ